MAEQNPLGNTHGNHSKVWHRLMEHINEGEWIDKTNMFREQELMALEDAKRNKDTAEGTERTLRRMNRRISLPLSNEGIAERRRRADERSQEAMQRASMSVAMQRLQENRVRIPEDVIRDKIFSYLY